MVQIVEQKPVLEDLLQALGFRTLSYPANEADDLIGTLTHVLDAADTDGAFNIKALSATQAARDGACHAHWPERPCSPCWSRSHAQELQRGHE